MMNKGFKYTELHIPRSACLHRSCVCELIKRNTQRGILRCPSEAKISDPGNCKRLW